VFPHGKNCLICERYYYSISVIRLIHCSGVTALIGDKVKSFIFLVII
jgi:hypothetical protein